MTPLYILTVGGMEVFQGYYFEDQILGIFIESERTVLRSVASTTDDDGVEQFAYKTTACKLADRLDLMGFTEEDCKREFTEGIDDYIKQLEHERESQQRLFASYPEYSTAKIQSFTGAIDALTNASLCDWVEAFAVSMDHEYLTDEDKNGLSALDRHLIETAERAEGYFPFSDLRHFVRACLCSAAAEEEVVLDYTTAVYEEKCSSNSLLAANANKALSESAKPGERIILLTEGPSDALILSRSLTKLFPHVAELFSFLDHTTILLWWWYREYSLSIKRIGQLCCC